MLLDNKTKSNKNNYFKVFDLLVDYVETGRVDIVTGYFSTSALAKFFNEVNNAKSFRMISICEVSHYLSIVISPKSVIIRNNVGAVLTATYWCRLIANVNLLIYGRG